MILTLSKMPIRSAHNDKTRMEYGKKKGKEQAHFHACQFFTAGDVPGRGSGKNDIWTAMKKWFPGAAFADMENSGRTDKCVMTGKKPAKKEK